MVVKEAKGQPSWRDLDLPDLRGVTDVMKLADLSVVTAAADAAEALLVLEHHLGFLAGAGVATLQSPLGDIFAKRENLPHIVEKRMDARERYVKHAVEAMRQPFEVWRVSYDDGTSRDAYIGLFCGRVQMLVIVSHVDGQTLWNFMQSDLKALNKHRHGVLIYQR